MTLHSPTGIQQDTCSPVVTDWSQDPAGRLVLATLEMEKLEDPCRTLYHAVLDGGLAQRQPLRSFLLRVWQIWGTIRKRSKEKERQWLGTAGLDTWCPRSWAIWSYA